MGGEYMLTVISLSELKCLLETRELTRSSNTDFIKDPLLRKLIEDKIVEMAGGELSSGFIAVLCGIKATFNKTLFERTTSSILRQIYLPPKPVGLLIPDQIPAIKVDREIFIDIVNNELFLEDEYTRDYVGGMFQMYREEDDNYSFAFLNKIELSIVSEILYGTEIAGSVSQLKMKADRECAVFTRTSIF